MGNGRRDVAEWICGFMALAIAIKVAAVGDAQLGNWVLQSPHIDLVMVLVFWVTLFWVTGALQLIALGCCNRRNPRLEGACGECALYPKCFANRMRRLAALVGAFAWIILFFAYRSPEGVTYLVMAAAQFYLFSMLSPRPRWKAAW